MFLGPVPFVSSQALHDGEQSLVRDAGWATVTGAFSSGIVLVAFALSLGANPMQIGILAAIPFVAQAAQLPASLLIERVE